MSYKINIHAHSIFSDGKNTPFIMALKAKELGFTALVITDHYYGPEHPEFMSENSMRLLKKSCKEARKIIPVIIGLEAPFMGEEVLVFGGAAISDILENGKPTMDKLLQLKKDTGCAVVLCHPGEDFELTIPAIDGFERFNHGMDMFGSGRRSMGSLENKPSWCNSDAHMADHLEICYNIVDTKIKNESDLIRYIKKGKQPKFCIEGGR